MPNLRTLWKPALYHGDGARPPFFEGWYFKLVDATEAHRYAVIPGVFIGRDPASSHAFVQTLDGATGRTTYHRYPFDAFRAARASSISGWARTASGSIGSRSTSTRRSAGCAASCAFRG